MDSGYFSYSFIIHELSDGKNVWKEWHILYMDVQTCRHSNHKVLVQLEVTLTGI